MTFRLRRRDAGEIDGDFPAEVPTAVAGDAGGTPEDDLKASAMRGNEALYGYVVALELLVVAILNLAITTGPGAPRHPNNWLAGLGVAGALALFGLIRVKNRTIVGFGAIIAAFLVTLPPVPSSLGVAHLFALAVPVGYALVITQRQRRIVSAQMKASRAARSRPAGRERPPAASGRSGRLSRRKEAEVPAGPRPNRRYTPPKSKRPQGKASGRR